MCSMLTSIKTRVKTVFSTQVSSLSFKPVIVYSLSLPRLSLCPTKSSLCTKILRVAITLGGRMERRPWLEGREISSKVCEICL